MINNNNNINFMQLLKGIAKIEFRFLSSLHFFLALQMEIRVYISMYFLRCKVWKIMNKSMENKERTNIFNIGSFSTRRGHP
jgi:hypothetical protein